MFFFSCTVILHIFFFSFHLSGSFVFLISHYFPSVSLSLSVSASLDLITPALLKTLPAFDWLPLDSCFSCTAFGHITDLCSLSVLWIVGLNHAACTACDSPTEWLRGHHFQPVRDCRATLPCQPVIISTSRPRFFSVALPLALSCSNRMITGC